MKKVLILLFLSLVFNSHLQVNREGWLSAGMKYKLDDKVDLAGALSSPMEGTILRTLYPELTLKYEFLVWLGISGDYRLLWDRNKWSNYEFSQRLSLHTQFKERINRFDLSIRLRLQNTIEKDRIGDNSFSAFRPGWRFKPEVLYDIENPIWSPYVSLERFNIGDFRTGCYLNKHRFSVGVDLELNGQ
jgi:hypothetical protein